MRQLGREVWAKLHEPDTWIMIVIVATVSLILGIVTGHLLGLH